MRFFKYLLPFLVILVCSWWAIKPFFSPGFFPMHDDTQVARAYEMHQALIDGMVPVRWVSDLGYGFGYPIFNFYAPFAYYLGGLLMFVFLNALIATKVMMAIGIILSGFCMYILAKEFWGKKGGLLSGVLYMYATYHAVDIYVRGDVAEFFAYAFIPLVFFGFYKISTSIDNMVVQNHEPRIMNHESKFLQIYNHSIWVFISAVSFTLIILSHNLSVFMLTPFLFLFLILLILGSNKKILFSFLSLISFLLSLALTAFYWLPAIFESKYTNVLSQVGGGADFHNHFVCLQQLWYSPWGYGGSASGCNDGLSFMLGKIYILLFVIGITSLIIMARKKIIRWNIAVFAFLGTLISLCLMLSFSAPIWEAVPFMPFLQYPWRYLLILAFFVAFISGSGIYFVNSFIKLEKIRAVILAVLVIFVIVLQAKFFQPQKILAVNSGFYTNKQNLLFATSKISDEYLPKDFHKPTSLQDVALIPFSSTKDVLVKAMAYRTQEKSATLSVVTPVLYSANIAYFPAWKVSIDGSNTQAQNYLGRLSFHLLPGNHQVLVRFVQTPLELAANAISAGGIVVLLVGIIILKAKKYDVPS